MAINTVISYPDCSGSQSAPISATPGQTVFVSTVPFSTNVHVYIDGIRQPSSSYTFTPGGFTLTWTAAVLTGGEEIILDIF